MRTTFVFTLMSAAAATLHAAPASGCTMVGGSASPQPSDVLEENAREMLGRGPAVVEVETLSWDSERALGAVRILRAFRGHYKSGQVVEVEPAGSPMCGPSTIEPGQRGIIMIDDREAPALPCAAERAGCVLVPPLFYGLIEQDLAEAIVRLAESDPR
jgi:hypothetical protein